MQLVSAGKSNLLELVQAVESWEARLAAAGAQGLGALAGLEERLARIGRENLHVSEWTVFCCWFGCGAMLWRSAWRASDGRTRT